MTNTTCTTYKRIRFFPDDICKFDPPLDPGIEDAVIVLRNGGIETFESCQGGPGHAYPEPTVRFHGDYAEGFKAITIAMQNGLKPAALRRTWPILDNEPTGPHWEMTFFQAPQ